MSKIIRNVIAGTLIAAMPVTASVAAVRPAAAIPAASAVSAVQNDDDDYARPVAWLPIGIIVATLLLAIYIASTKQSEGRGNISRA